MARSFSKTTMLNTDVPALMFPVFALTLFVAAIPVPASPSGGQKGIPASRSPLGSRNLAPASVRFPAASPAIKTLGKTSLILKPKALTSGKASNLEIYSEL